MPDLPTITVTQAQADYIIAVFGGTQAVAIPAYKKWLSNTVRTYVLDQVSLKVDVDSAAAKLAASNAAIAAAVATLPPPLP